MTDATRAYRAHAYAARCDALIARMRDHRDAAARKMDAAELDILAALEAGAPFAAESSGLAFDAWADRVSTLRFRIERVKRLKRSYVDFPCCVCGRDIGWNAPSGVCSRECLNRGMSY